MTTYHLMVAPNGARRRQADHAGLPLRTAEIAATAATCQRAGADALHLHVRDRDGGHSLDAGRYRAAMAAVAEAAPGMAIQITTESAGVFDVADQLACLEALRPTAASISVRELARDADLAARAYAICAEAGTQVQHILYDLNCVAQLRAGYAAGRIPAAMRSTIFVLGRYAPPRLAHPAGLRPFLAATADLDLDWGLCAFGQEEHACLLAGLEAGGRLRIGFENNTQAADGSEYPDNAASVAAFVALARAAGHRPHMMSVFSDQGTQL
ncbi:3-keto-5-aminohexanoate cleavage protein [Phaeobacter sp. HS012]|uniref:3-keto-5-aminohexanoate cleavage protein n=1 Tax=unclassified Phaeobacter TaxID=2621772 RepID=UPI001B36CDFD|nr:MULTISPECIES: 3-keto-5-aminohexanoate cleavage protein [unclassified Phaeobacter]MBQ4807912.1 3-keto-5-aminohexanoate cleavage protein [Phaeobacter sp. HS012]MBQ4882761.1 3-keto-5-aminohexanoate cleavage protein [Phaeobacter sp. HS011]